jgi:hypothetical protein
VAGWLSFDGLPLFFGRLALRFDDLEIIFARSSWHLLHAT